MILGDFKTLDDVKKFVSNLRRGVLRKQKCDDRFTTARGLERQLKMLVWKKHDRGPVFFLAPYNESVAEELVMHTVWVETRTRKVIPRPPVPGQPQSRPVSRKPR